MKSVVLLLLCAAAADSCSWESTTVHVTATPNVHVTDTPHGFIGHYSLYMAETDDDVFVHINTACNEPIFHQNTTYALYLSAGDIEWHFDFKLCPAGYWTISRSLLDGTVCTGKHVFEADVAHFVFDSDWTWPFAPAPVANLTLSLSGVETPYDELPFEQWKAGDELTVRVTKGQPFRLESQREQTVKLVEQTKMLSATLERLETDARTEHELNELEVAKLNQKTQALAEAIRKINEEVRLQIKAMQERAREVIERIQNV